MNNCTLYDISTNIVPVNILFLIKYYIFYNTLDMKFMYFTKKYKYYYNVYMM